MGRSCAVLWVALVLSSCALMSKGEPITPRYFTPEARLAAPAVHATSGADKPRVRLGRITAAAELRERIVYRKGDEIGFYPDRRWAERPERYLHRALSQALFERRGFVRAVGGPAPTLQAELVDFEEVRTEPPFVRVTIMFVLDDEHDAVIEQTVRSERPLPARGRPPPEAVVSALGEALHAAVEAVAERVGAALAVANVDRPQCDFVAR